jgi:hypothetical protein
LARIAFFGVRCTGWTAPNHLGSVPVSPILNQIRVDTLLHAWQTASVELNIAASTKTQPAPQSRCAISSPGRSGALTRALELLPIRMEVPQPMIWPQ